MAGRPLSPASGGERSGGDDRGLAESLIATLTSTRFAAVVMAALITMSVIGLAVPQASLLPAKDMDLWRRAYPWAAEVAAALAFDRIYNSWYFLLAVAALMLSVLLCTYKRVAAGAFRRRTPFLSARAAAKRGIPWRKIDLDPKTAARQAAAAFKAPWLRADESTAGTTRMVTWSGGRFGLVGSVVAHCALAIVAVGAVVGSLTSLQADMVITEGQTVQVGRAAFGGVRSLPVLGGVPQGFAVALDKLAFEYKKGLLEGATADMRVLEGQRVIERRVRVNYPLEHKGVSFLLSQVGYSTRLVVRKEGRLLDDTFVNLKQRYAQGFGDRYRVPGGPELPVFVVPDSRLARTESARTPYILTRPAAYLGSRESALGLVGPLEVGKTAKIAGLDVTLADVRLYSVMMVRGNQGRPILYTGLWLIVAGAIMRFADPRRELMLAIRPRRGGSEVACLGRSAYGRMGLGRMERTLGRALGTEIVSPIEEDG